MRSQTLFGCVLVALMVTLVVGQTTVTTVLRATRAVTLIEESRVCGQCDRIMISNTVRNSSGLVWFDVAGGLPSDAVISSVTLTLPIQTLGSGLPQLVLSLAERAWNQSKVTGTFPDGNPPLNGEPTYEQAVYPDTYWTNNGGATDSPLSMIIVLDTNAPDATALTGITDAAIKSAVSEWHSNASANYGFSIRIREGSAAGVVYLGSQLTDPSTVRPALSVTYTTSIGAPPPPVPSQNFAQFGAPRQQSNASGAIVGGVIGGICVVMIIISVATVCMRR